MKTYFNIFLLFQRSGKKWRIYTQCRDAKFSVLVKRFEGNNEETRNFLANYVQPLIINIQKLLSIMNLEISILHQGSNWAENKKNSFYEALNSKFQPYMKQQHV